MFFIQKKIISYHMNKITKIEKVFYPFKDHLKQQETNKTKKKKKIISPISKIKDDNLIGWA